jgi:hypothetical protein
MGNEMPKKKDQTSTILIIAVYLLLFIIALKLFKIIPDPSPEIDLNLVIGILALAVAVSTALAGWVSRQWSAVTDKITDLEKVNRDISTNLKVIEQRISSLECNVDLRERIAKLEAITTKKG